MYEMEIIALENASEAELMEFYGIEPEDLYPQEQRKKIKKTLDKAETTWYNNYRVKERRCSR